MKNRKILTILLLLCMACTREEVYLEEMMGEKIGGFWEIDEGVYARLLGDSSFLCLSDAFREARLAYNADLADTLVETRQFSFAKLFDVSRQVLEHGKFLGIENLLAYCYYREERVSSRAMHEWGPCFYHSSTSGVVCDTYANWLAGWETYGPMEGDAYGHFYHTATPLDLSAFRIQMCRNLMRASNSIDYSRAYAMVTSTFPSDIPMVDALDYARGYDLNRIRGCFYNGNFCQAMHDLNRVFQAAFLSMDFKEVVIPYPGANGDPVAPPGGLIKAIFSSTSQLTIAQWVQVEKALQEINNDCMGGRLVDTLRGMKVTLKHDKGIRGSGNFERNHRVLSIKDFNDTTRLERTLLHELVHAAQPDNPDAQLNREIEARVGTFRYAKRNEGRLSVSATESNYMRRIDQGMDSKYNVTDPFNYSRGYERVMNFLMNNGYGDRTETAENRNFKTVKSLSKDC